MLAAAFTVLVMSIPRCEPGLPLSKNTNQNIEESKGRGDLIARALENYKSQFGRYPASLTDLTDKLGVVVEPPVVAVAEWDYFAYEAGSSYALRFCLGKACYPNYKRTAGSSEWVHDG